jgi:hypothetical protein
MGLFDGGRMVKPDKLKYCKKSAGRQRAVDRAAQAVVDGSSPKRKSRVNEKITRFINNPKKGVAWCPETRRTWRLRTKCPRRLPLVGVRTYTYSPMFK